MLMDLSFVGMDRVRYGNKESYERVDWKEIEMQLKQALECFISYLGRILWQRRCGRISLYNERPPIIITMR